MKEGGLSIIRNPLLTRKGIVSGLLILLGLMGTLFIAYDPLGNAPDVKKEVDYSKYIPDYTRFSLENGLSAIILEQSKVPIVTLVGVVKAGALYQNEDKQGVFHFIEHLFMSGVREDLQQIGAVANAYTSQDHLYYYLSFPKDKWQQGLSILEKIMTKPKWDHETLEKERDVIISEASVRISEPEKEVLERMNVKLWGKDAFKLNTVGTPEQIRNISLEDMKETYDNYIRPERSLVFVAGDLGGLNVAEDIRRSLGGWEKGKPIPEPFGITGKPELQTETGTLVSSEQIREYTNLYIVWKGPGTSDSIEDTYIADIISTVINNKSSLFGKQIQAAGYINDYSLYYSTKKCNGTIVLQVSVKQEDLEKAKNRLLEIIRNRSIYENITASEILSAAKSISFGYVKSLETPSETAKLLSVIWAADSLDYADRYIDNINQISTEDVHRFADRYLLGQDYVWGAVVNQPNLLSVEQVIESK